MINLIISITVNDSHHEKLDNFNESYHDKLCHLNVQGAASWPLPQC